MIGNDLMQTYKYPKYFKKKKFNLLSVGLYLIMIKQRSETYDLNNLKEGNLMNDFQLANSIDTLIKNGIIEKENNKIKIKKRM
ncbi:hypothetical protein [Virgibacillus sp. DJP39]|uniref:hypothetical protein n=1 Tax=Virgibacillus sp. DJP39 TaxID=3409790 RepID=UPI003BB631E5